MGHFGWRGGHLNGVERMNWEIFRSKTRPFEEQQNELGTLSLRNGAYRKAAWLPPTVWKAGMSTCSVCLSHQIGMDDLGCKWASGLSHGDFLFIRSM